MRRPHDRDPIARAAATPRERRRRARDRRRLDVVGVDDVDRLPREHVGDRGDQRHVERRPQRVRSARARDRQAPRRDDGSEDFFLIDLQTGDITPAS